MPEYSKKPLRYMGFLEIRKTPLVTGSSSGVVAKFTLVIMDITEDRIKMARPMYNHAVPIFNGRKIE